MRLIDADALKADLQKFFPEECLDGITSRTLFAQILTDISNAPTSEYPCVIKVKTEVDAQRVSDELRRLAKMGVIFPVEDIEVKRLERPQGEWIEESSETGALGIKYTWVRCNQCGWNNSLVIPKNFCPNCGAKMQKGGAE